MGVGVAGRKGEGGRTIRNRRRSIGGRGVGREGKERGKV